MRLAVEAETEATEAAASPLAAEDGSLPDEGVVVGRYRLLETIGEGGMGKVYRAEQQEPVRREVAVKFVKWGMDTKEVLGRFEAERQALALMSHPAIARVFDGGATREGRPYFVMEYVRGVPITRFCDLHRLGIEDRLALFLQICDGVQHAHQKGIIHRDLKPSNVLVTYEGERPVAKVIDFGIAKATGLRLTQETLFTQIGRPIGTPKYMSPEQADAGIADVDTRTDVYSLGVILYELLVGESPFHNTEGSSFEELLRNIREEDPARPSTRLGGTPTDETSHNAQLRGTELPALRRRLKGDLDWIVMMALEKDRARRYGSPTELAADIERHLRDEPVVAGPPDLGYRLGKLVKRNRLAVAAGAVVAAGVVVAIAGTTIGLVRAREAEAVAASEAAKATAINEFLQDVLGSADPYERLGRDVTVIEALDEAAQRVDRDFGQQPAIRAAVEATIGGTYTRLSRYAEARPLLLDALSTQRELYDGDHPDIAELALQIGYLERLTGSTNAALPYVTEALEMSRRIHGSEHAAVAGALTELAMIENDRGEFDAAEGHFREAVAIQRRLYDPPNLELADGLDGLGMVLGNKGEYDEAIRLFREGLAQRQAIHGARHLFVADSQNSLALSLNANGHHEEAVELIRSALSTRRELLGEDHHAVAESWSTLGTVLVPAGDMAGAEEAFGNSLELFRKLFPDGHTKVARALHSVSSIHNLRGDLDQAIRFEREALAMNLAQMGEDHPVVGIVRLALAGLLHDGGISGEAVAESREGLRILEASLPPDHWRIASAHGQLGEALTGDGSFEEAEHHLLDSLEGVKATRPPGSGYVRTAMDRLISLYESWGREAEVKRWRTERAALG